MYYEFKLVEFCECVLPNLRVYEKTVCNLGTIHRIKYRDKHSDHIHWKHGAKSWPCVFEDERMNKLKSCYHIFSKPSLPPSEHIYLTILVRFLLRRKSITKSIILFHIIPFLNYGSSSWSPLSFDREDTGGNCGGQTGTAGTGGTP